MKRNLPILIVMIFLSAVGIYAISRFVPVPAPEVSVFVTSPEPGDTQVEVYPKPPHPDPVIAALSNGGMEMVETMSGALPGPADGNHQALPASGNAVADWPEDASMQAISDVTHAMSSFSAGKISGSLIGEMDVVLSPRCGGTKVYRGYAFSSDDDFLILVVPAAKDSVAGEAATPVIQDDPAP